METTRGTRNRGRAKNECMYIYIKLYLNTLASDNLYKQFISTRGVTQLVKYLGSRDVQNYEDSGIRAGI